jgi:hypothetical protein
MTGNNARGLGFETTQKRIDDLSTLVVKFPEQQPIVPTEDSGVYELKLTDLKYDYLFMIDVFADMTKSGCTFSKVPLRPIQHDDYLDALRDPFNNSSTEFLLYNTGRSSDSTSSSIYMYPDPSYTVDKVYLEYVKYPAKVSYGGYQYVDGITYPAQTFDLPEHTHREIVDIAVQLAAISVENPEYIQLKNLKRTLSE